MYNDFNVKNITKRAVTVSNIQTTFVNTFYENFSPLIMRKMSISQKTNNIYPTSININTIKLLTFTISKIISEQLKGNIYKK